MPGFGANQLLGASPAIASPWEDPPPPPTQWNWREAKPMPLGIGAGTAGFAAPLTARPGGGPEIGPAVWDAPGYSDWFQRQNHTPLTSAPGLLGVAIGGVGGLGGFGGFGTSGASGPSGALVTAADVAGGRKDGTSPERERGWWDRLKGWIADAWDNPLGLLSGALSS